MKDTILTLLLCFTLLLAGCTSPDQVSEWDPNGVIIEAEFVNDFTLTTSENTPWTFSEEAQNTTVIVAFLFTNCIDICPIVTHNMKWVQSQLTPEERNLTTFLTITVDPWRDNATIMEEWKTRTKSNWTHLTVSNTDANSEEMKTLNKVWGDFGVGFKIEENQTQTNTSGRHHPSATDYNIDHSTGTVLIDHEGNQRIWWGDFDWIIDLVKEDILTLVEEAEKP